MKLRPYPKYKNSGVEWLGEIPEEWGTESLRRIGRITNGSTPDSTNEKYWNGNIVWFTPDDLGKNQTKYIRESKRKITVAGYKNCGTVIVPKNSLILSTRAPIGHLALTAVDACFNQGCRGIVFKNNFNPSFYYYYFLSIKGVLNAYGQGTTFFELGANKLAIIPVVIPPEKEKETIVNLLDQKTSKIDDLIKKNERLIELLREKRQAIISQAVTKGLNQNVKMKDSGIEWLGEIPEGWEVTRLRRIVLKFIDYRGRTPEKVDYGIPLITAKNFENGKINFKLSQEFIKEEDYDSWMVRGLPEKGDIIITTEAPLGESAQIQDPKVALAQRIILLKTNKKRIANDYMKYLFLSNFGQNTLLREATGSTALGIKASKLKSILLLVPTLYEQNKISEYLYQATDNIDKLTEKVQSQIEKLKEYRQALISNVVTGKVRASDKA